MSMNTMPTLHQDHSINRQPQQRHTQAEPNEAKAGIFSSLALCILLAGCAGPKPGHEAWTVLFDGSSTAAFRGFHMDSFPKEQWTVEDGLLKSIPGKGVDLISREKFEDFDLELECKVSVSANSGILYGVTEATAETYWSGPEMQINDDPNHPDGLVAKTAAGSLYDLLPPDSHKQLKPTGEFDRFRIVSTNGHVEHWLNGAKILEYDWSGTATRDLIAHSKFKNAPYFMKERNGHIALQHHGDAVWFRNIRIRRL